MRGRFPYASLSVGRKGGRGESTPRPAPSRTMKLPCRSFPANWRGPPLVHPAGTPGRAGSGRAMMPGCSRPDPDAAPARPDDSGGSRPDPDPPLSTRHPRDGERTPDAGRSTGGRRIPRTGGAVESERGVGPLPIGLVPHLSGQVPVVGLVRLIRNSSSRAGCRPYDRIGPGRHSHLGLTGPCRRSTR